MIYGCPGFPGEAHKSFTGAWKLAQPVANSEYYSDLDTGTSGQGSGVCLRRYIEVIKYYQDQQAGMCVDVDVMLITLQVLVNGRQSCAVAQLIGCRVADESGTRTEFGA